MIEFSENLPEYLPEHIYQQIIYTFRDKFHGTVSRKVSEYLFRIAKKSNKEFHKNSIFYDTRGQSASSSKNCYGPKTGHFLESTGLTSTNLNLNQFTCFEELRLDFGTKYFADADRNGSSFYYGWYDMKVKDHFDQKRLQMLGTDFRSQIEDTTQDSNPKISFLQAQLKDLRDQLVDQMIRRCYGQISHAEFNSLKNLELLRNYKNTYFQLTAEKSTKFYQNSIWSSHYKLDDQIRHTYIQNVYQPSRCMQNSEWMVKSKTELQKNLAKNLKPNLEAKKLKFMPPNQVNMRMLSRLQKQMPKLLENSLKCLEKDSSKKSAVSLTNFPRNHLNFSKNSSNFITIQDEYVTAKKSKYNYLPEIFSPCDSLLRIWDFNYRERHSPKNQLHNSKLSAPAGREQVRNFHQELVDFERLRICLGVDEIPDSPLKFILAKKNPVDENEMEFSNLFTQIFTWPMICSQIMPSISIRSAKAYVISEQKYGLSKFLASDANS